MKVSLSSDEAGFTLLEALISLSITSMILLLVMSGVLQVKAINEYLIMDAQSIHDQSIKIKGSRQIEWHIFLNQLEYYLKDSKLVEISREHFIVDEWNPASKAYERVRYHRTHGGMRHFRRSKASGNIAMLTEIKDFELEQVDGWLILRFQFRNNEEFTGKMRVESWMESELEEEQREDESISQVN